METCLTEGKSIDTSPTANRKASLEGIYSIVSFPFKPILLVVDNALWQKCKEIKKEYMHLCLKASFFCLARSPTITVSCFCKGNVLSDLWHDLISGSLSTYWLFERGRDISLFFMSITLSLLFPCSTLTVFQLTCLVAVGVSRVIQLAPNFTFTSFNVIAEWKQVGKGHLENPFSHPCTPHLLSALLLALGVWITLRLCYLMVYTLPPWWYEIQ